MSIIELSYSDSRVYDREKRLLEMLRWLVLTEHNRNVREEKYKVNEVVLSRND